MKLSDINVQREEVHRFYRDYYRTDILNAVKDGETHLVLEWSDIWAWNSEIAEDYLVFPEVHREMFEEDLREFDIPVDMDVELDVRVRLPKDKRQSVIDIEAENDEKYVAVEGRISKSSGRYTRLETLVFQCSSCGHTLELDQDLFSVNQPNSKCDCEYGQWQMMAERAQRVNHVGFELQQPPGEASGDGENIVVHCDGDLVYRGEYLPNHTGQRVVVHGTIEVDATELEKKHATPKVEEYLDAHWIEFKDGVADDVQADEHLERIEELSNREDAPHLFAKSILPEFWGQERMNEPLLACVAYLFGSYRLSSGGRNYRGDIHGMLAGDPGSGKSTMASRVSEISMRCESVSGPQVTGPGLTASASQDSFAGSEWTLTPGVLPRADGGHVVIDELDKSKSSATEALHDALEGEQVVKAAKANQQATMSTKVGLLATANPTDGRFNKTERWGQQLDVDDALFDRFDFIFAFKDRIDEDRDRNIAESILGGMHESAEMERKARGKVDEAPKDVTDQPVDDEVLSAWVAYARDNCFPEFPTGEASERLAEYYIDARNRNSDSDGDSAIPTGPRTLQAGIRLAVAFARCRLSDKVELCDVELAIEITDRSMADMFFDPQTGEWNGDMPKTGSQKTQDEKIRAIKEALHGGLQYPLQVAHEVGVDEDYARKRLQKLARTDDDVEEKNGKFRSLTNK